LATEQGIVIKLEAEVASVSMVKSSACKGCSIKGHCRPAEDGKEMEVEALNAVGAQIGDKVVVSFETSSLLKISFLLYIFPILSLIAGAFLGEKLSEYSAFSESASSVIFAFLFFIAAFLVIKATGNRLAKKSEYRPKIIKILRASKLASIQK
jgi:sigma-E factor negative regulatory protein RseC